MAATPSDTHWFPMYVTYRREERIKHQLDNMGIENFLPPDRWFFMENRDCVSKDAKKVEFVEGDCVGIRGVIKRVKGNRHVIVRLGDYASIAIKIQHISQLRNLDA